MKSTSTITALWTDLTLNKEIKVILKACSSPQLSLRLSLKCVYARSMFEKTMAYKSVLKEQYFTIFGIGAYLKPLTSVSIMNGHTESKGSLTNGRYQSNHS